MGIITLLNTETIFENTFNSNFTIMEEFNGK